VINLSRDIHPLTDFKRKTNEFARQMKETGQPVILTVNGKAEFVIQDADSYQAMLERIERAEAIEGVRRGLEQMQRGEGRPAEEVFTEMETKLGGSPA